MSTWNSVVFIKSDKKWDDFSAVSQWEGVENIWSTSGEWDWCVKLSSASSSPEQAEKFVSRIREGHWATETKTNWWKEVSAK